MEVNQLRVQCFWDYSFLNEAEKRKFDHHAKVSIYSHYIAWVITVVTFIFLCTAPYFPPAVYNEDWSYLGRFFVKTCGYVYVLFGFYLLTTHECFCAYTVLHGYFQLNTLKAYLRHEFQRYAKVDLEDKIKSFKYQALIEGALLRCTKHHKKLVK